jgi:DNA mismatch endonuclease (patch repair protein)
MTSSRANDVDPILSNRMRSIRSKNTTPELVVRRVLHRLGFRFRLHQASLPGTPDIVLARHRAVILVHGCFWHQHPGCSLAKQPRARPEYWLAKLEGNITRDRRDRRQLKAQGFRAIVVWECQTRLPEVLAQRLARLLSNQHR